MAASAGLFLYDWQQYVLDVALGERPDGRFAAFEVGLIVPRQNGKGSVLEARELFGLFVAEEDLILHSAHEFRTANEAFLRIVSLVENTPDLMRKVSHIRYANGEQGIELKSGQRLKFVARTRGGGRGLSADCVILDEAYNLDEAAMAALLPTLSTKDNPQIWYASSAPMVTSSQLKAVRKRAATGDPSLALMEWSIDPSGDITDPALWAQANPSLGLRISADYVIREFAALAENPQAFARERLGVPDGDDGAGGEIPLDLWLSLVDPQSQVEGSLSIALDVNPERSWASFASAGVRSDGLSHVEVVDRRSGTGWVVDRAVELHQRWNVPIVLDPSSPAGGLVADLAAAGVPVVEVGQRDHAQACGGLVDAVRNRVVRHLGQASLFAALTGAEKRKSGDVWLWSRSASHVDITPLVAVTLALHASRGPGTAEPFFAFT